MIRRHIRALRSSDPTVRRNAVAGFAAERGRRTLKDLVSCLYDCDAAVRRTAATTLERRIWNPTSADDRRQFAIALQRWDDRVLHSQEANRLLTIALADLDAHVRANALAALERNGWQPSNLRESVLTEVARQQFNDAVAFGAEGVALALASTADDAVRDQATEALAQAEEPPLRVYMDALGDDNVETRKSAAKLLVRADAAAVAPLLEVMQAGDRYRAQLAAFILGRIADPTSLTDLLELAVALDPPRTLLRDDMPEEQREENRPVRSAVVLAVARIASSTPEALGTCITERQDLANSAVDALVCINNDRALDVLEASLPALKAAGAATMNGHTIAKRAIRPQPPQLDVGPLEDRFGREETAAFQRPPATILQISTIGLDHLLGYLLAFPITATVFALGLLGVMAAERYISFLDSDDLAIPLPAFIGLFVSGLTPLIAYGFARSRARRRASKLRPHRTTIEPAWVAAAFMSVEATPESGEDGWVADYLETAMSMKADDDAGADG